MAAYDFDLFTIGAGSGGVRASRTAAGYGARSAIAEVGALGGTCVNVGCVPKKLLVYGAHYRDDFHEAAGFGWTVDGARLDWSVLIANQRAEVARLNGVYARLMAGAGVELVPGWARIVDPHTVEITAADGSRRCVTAEHILVATGGKPVRATEPGAEHGLVSDDVFSLPRRPDRLVVVGGGYIAVELACVFNGLGSDVTIVYRGPQFLRGFDDEVRSFLAGELDKKGIRLVFGARVERVTRDASGLSCTLSNGEWVGADDVLYAIGRRPNTDGLGLREVGVELDANGAIVVDDRFRTCVPSISALGDVTNRVNLTPVAIAEAMALTRTLFGGVPTSMDYRDIPTAVFTSPPLATVGLTEAEARQSHDGIDIYTSEFRPMRHTLSGSDERTFMKLVVDRSTDRVIGAHMVGADAPEIIQGLAVALKANATKAQFDATVGVHPTAAEEFVTMRVRRPD